MHFVLAALTVGLAGEAHAQAATDDPFEKFNRAMYSFNEAVDKYALEPVARGYRAITPAPFREGVGNMLHNLKSPVIFANDVLQAAPTRAGATVARFGINSTIGIAGIFDVASTMGLEKHNEDFGQTLGRWGLAAGPYLVLPLLGPSSVRDATGSVVDVALNPINYAQFDGDDAFRVSRTVVGAIDAREGALDAVQNLRESSIDPYVSIRTTYGILRESAVRNGLTNVQDLPEFEEIPSQGISDPGVQPSNETPSAEPAPEQPQPTPTPPPNSRQGN
ncbi:MAG: VacJ family lipoprotein [Hyphomonadaceae bacterium]|nr:VacJ family lipoprotein [Hyphomonadaceae bacterium]